MVILPLERAAATTPRVALARLARESSVAVESVIGTDAGAVGTRATFGGGDRVAGVVCTAGGGGAYSLHLFLVTEPVPLHPLAARVRRRVREDAARAGLDAFVGPIDIDFVDIADTVDAEGA